MDDFKRWVLVSRKWSGLSGMDYFFDLTRVVMPTENDASQFYMSPVSLYLEQVPEEETSSSGHRWALLAVWSAVTDARL